ncbi:MAG: hypothetical protein ACQSGP_00210, partial [Frankia sp.]
MNTNKTQPYPPLRVAAKREKNCRKNRDIQAVRNMGRRNHCPGSGETVKPGRLRSGTAGDLPCYVMVNSGSARRGAARFGDDGAAR